MDGGLEVANYELDLIGVFRLRRGGEIIPVRHNEQRPVALLGVLGAMTRGEAALHLWPNAPPERARASLRSALSRLRAQVDGLVGQDSDVLDLRTVRVDLAEAISWAKAALSPEPTPVPSVPPYAVGRDLLAAWQEEWLTQPREELRLLELGALEAVAGRLTTHNRLGLAASLARTATRLDPLRESAARTLIEIHMREGNTAAALREFERIQQVVHHETGTHLNASLTALVATLGVPDVQVRRNRVPHQ